MKILILITAVTYSWLENSNKPAPPIISPKIFNEVSSVCILNMVFEPIRELGILSQAAWSHGQWNDCEVYGPLANISGNNLVYDGCSNSAVVFRYREWGLAL